MIDQIDRRVLGAIAFTDSVTGARIAAPLDIACPGVQLTRNRSSLYVIRDALGLHEHTLQFEAPPATPLKGTASFPLQVSDPQRRYLPRASTLHLPRVAPPTDDVDALLTPIGIVLMPSSNAPSALNWALLRVSVRVPGTQIGLGNVWIHLAPMLAGFAATTAMTDALGEAVLMVPGVPPVRAADGDFDPANPAEVMSTTFTAAVEAAFDPTLVRRSDQVGDLPLADPDAIAAQWAQVPAPITVLKNPAVTMAASSSRSLLFELAWP